MTTPRKPSIRRRCRLKLCGKRFRTKPRGRIRLYCCDRHSDIARNQRRLGRRKLIRRIHPRAPAFMVELIREGTPGLCVFDCGAEAHRHVCKDPECVRTYKRLWYHEKQALKRAA